MKYGVNMHDLAKCNDRTISNHIITGEVLRIPLKDGVVAPSNDMTVISLRTAIDPRMQNETGKYKVIMAPNTVGGDIHAAGGGLGMMIRTPNGKTIMIDGGRQYFDPGTTNFQTGQGTGELANIKAWLSANSNNHVDAWIITHPHNDHARVPAAIVNEGNVHIDKVYGVQYPKTLHDARSGESPLQSAYVYDAFTLMQSAGKYTEIKEGSSFTLDGVTVEFMNALNLNLWRENDSSAVMRLSFEGSDRTMMLLADIQEAGADLLMARFSNKLKADVVQMAHHALDDLSELYRRIGASIILIPAGKTAISRPQVQNAIRSLQNVAPGATYDAADSWQMVEIFK